MFIWEHSFTSLFLYFKITSEYMKDITIKLGGFLTCLHHWISMGPGLAPFGMEGHYNNVLQQRIYHCQLCGHTELLYYLKWIKYNKYQLNTYLKYNLSPYEDLANFSFYIQINASYSEAGIQRRYLLQMFQLECYQ